MTNLKDLLAKAKVSPAEKLVKRSAEWKTTDAEGRPETYLFTFFIVEQISFAASDRIYFGSRTEEDRSAAARAIVERIRLGENGEEKATLDDVLTTNPSLGWLLVAEINKFDAERNPKEDPAKDSSQTTNSGTNSSSTESAEVQ